MLTKNQIITAEITDITSEGSGVCRADGFAVFVPDTAVGDVAEVRIVKVLKSYAYGIIEKLITPSSDRVTPECPHYKKCGGCVFMHISYEAECRIKSQIVSDAFTRIGHLAPAETLPIFGAEETEGYRNKAQYPYADYKYQDGKVFPEFGFYAPRSHRLVPVTYCDLQPFVFGDILRLCREELGSGELPCITPYNEENGSGVLRHIYIRQGFHSKEIMVCFITAKDSSQIRTALTTLGNTVIRNFPDVRSVMLNVNPLKTNVILGDKTVCLLGNPVIADTLCGVPVTLSPQSFYQVNTAQAERLFAEAKRLAAPKKDELLLDLYCGAGAIGLSMADSVDRVIGVEVVPQAIEDAKANAERAGIKNAEFYAGDAGEIAARFAAEGKAPDIIVLDPPRKGCDELTLKACVDMSPSRIVMISCNPSTAARDAAYLCGRGFALDVLRPADFFPRTRHVECVVLMSKFSKDERN
ncbi:MAG: 23S rRNA (uracil(1939)-C(5))-methyltransferase RlmD [Ruminococcus sp.]|nr:23S rRNA (uracil(1939)-C(5))-methyltransferase RlmD [Ruminococcus sp.]